MAVKPIAHSYWRRIKDGARDFDSVPDTVKEDVCYLAQQDVIAGVITADEYEEIIGEPFEEE